MKKTEEDFIPSKNIMQCVYGPPLVERKTERKRKCYEISLFRPSDMSQIYKGEFTDSVCLGKGIENDIRLVSQSVSRKHCRITNKNGKFFIEDLHSANGTFVNGNKVDGEVEIVSGMTICMGKEELKITFEKAGSCPKRGGLIERLGSLFKPRTDREEDVLSLPADYSDCCGNCQERMETDGKYCPKRGIFFCGLGEMFRHILKDLR